MKKLLISLLLTGFTSALLAYQDYDIDGVEDHLDQCPNTSFDELVDENGCGRTQLQHKSVITLKVGYERISDDTYGDSNALNLYANFKNGPYRVSLSNYNYVDTGVNNSSSVGDIFLTGGYKMPLPQSSLLISAGIKFPTADEDLGTGESDLLASLYYTYYLDKQTDLFAYYGYTFTGDSDETTYENISTLSVGAGYAFNKSYYSALSYDYAESIFEDVDARSSLSWFHSYDFNDRYFMTFNYAYGLNDEAYDHLFSLKFGVNLE